jgi:hypothetical protein
MGNNKALVLNTVLSSPIKKEEIVSLKKLKYLKKNKIPISAIIPNTRSSFLFCLFVSLFIKKLKDQQIKVELSKINP